MKNPYPFLLAIAAALVAGGCASPEGAYQPVNTTQFDHENRSNFVLMDKGAQRSVTCSGIQQTTLADGRLQVAANVRNRE
ncbi:MAG: hypothetical protein ACYC23_14685, partial [Limisphaerales bacterium]